MSRLTESLGAVASSSKASSAAPSTVESSFGTDIRLLQSISSSFHSQCRDAECKAPLTVTDTKEHIETWLAGAQKIPPASQVSGLTCGSCYLATCAGCGFEPTLGPENIFTSSGVVNTCCLRGRLYGIWLLLTDFDNQEISARKDKAQPKPPKPKKVKSAFPYAVPSGIFADQNGVGYAGGWEYDDQLNRLTATTFAVNSEEEYPDAATTLNLKLLTASIPSPDSPDTAPLVDELLCVFRYSLFMDRVAGLVRNDSIADLIERRELYYALFTFIEAIADHPSLRILLFEQRLNLKITPGLRVLAAKTDSRHAKIDTPPEDRLPSIFTYSRNIYKQSMAFTKMLGKAPEGYLDHSKESARMCQTVIKVYGKMQLDESLELVSESNIGQTESWVKFCEDHRVIFTDDVLLQHRFSAQSIGLKASNQKGRLSAIGKEIANMTTSLPHGIFLKVAESRSDVMKALIVGVEGTPYAGGLFSFDIFLDANYPNSPPKMAFVLDGNDSEEWSFNPNLHKGSGTVCLSIINTWQGSPSEMWQPGKTTILAVLISIQAMILGAAIPWINEPGYIGQAETQQAADHKLLIQYKTVRYAMIGWLGKTARSENVIWDDISKAYWKQNGSSVMSTVKEWAKNNPQILTGTRAQKRKPKKKDPFPPFASDTPAENLVEKLSILLDLGTTLEVEPAAEESLTTSSKPNGKATTKSKGAKTATSKGKGKRKASELSDDDDDDDPYGDDQSPSSFGADLNGDVKTPSADATTAGESKRKKRTPASKGKAKAKAKQVAGVEERTWTYSGGKTQKETRQACSEFGITGAKSIKDTIFKLEAYVNDNELWDDPEALVWGTLQTI